MKTESKDRSADHTFIHRPYNKTELAQLYMPNYIRKVALRKFNHWLRHSPQLWESLQAQGFNITSRDLTYEQVQTIIDHLGVP
ncbi:DUF4248 domain-containing protein [Bacteroides sp. 51]|uniref:DUF4248 domain-containing protein n=1 Tax=Bacteroides sp. 51 TaxID=2302938 RepID=UPI0013D6BD06|nr:DUF4248 domain-containing protein [Bacteroides sp. 51]